MKIYIGNLPSRITPVDLAFFINSHQRHPLLALLFNDEVKIDHCQIVRTVAKNGQVACFGVAHAFPRKNAYKLIKRLNGKTLKGRMLEVREYYVRMQARDRRGTGWELRPFPGLVDRRLRDRRTTTRLDDL